MISLSILSLSSDQQGRPAFWGQPDVACAGLPPEWWYPYYNADDAPKTREEAQRQDANIERAKAICRTCPHRLPCLQWGLDHPDETGIWGGVPEGTRRKMRKRHG